jgi:DNA-binding CsgD family transcriptional regulator
MIPTRRQIEALQHRANGLTHQQTAKRMGIQPSSLDDILSAARRSLAAKTTHHAIAEAMRYGYIR